MSHLSLPITKLAYHEEGTDNDPTLVLLHPEGVLHNYWQPQFKALAKSHHIIAPDLYYEDKSQFTVENLANEVLAIIRKRGHADIHLIGHWLRCIRRPAIASKQPNRIASLVLSGTQLVGGGWRSTMKQIALRLLPTFVTARLLTRAMTHHYPPMRDTILQDASRVGASGWRAGLQAIAQTDFTKNASKLMPPILVLSGGGSYRLSSAKALNRFLPNAVLRVIPLAGTYISLDYPDQFSDIITDFVAEPQHRVEQWASYEADAEPIKLSWRSDMSRLVRSLSIIIIGIIVMVIIATATIDHNCYNHATLFLPQYPNAEFMDVQNEFLRPFGMGITLMTLETSDDADTVRSWYLQELREIREANPNFTGLATTDWDVVANGEGSLIYLLSECASR